MRSTASQFGDCAQHGVTYGIVALNERVRAERSRNFCCVAVLLD
jgi:hypothetical protein